MAVGLPLLLAALALAPPQDGWLSCNAWLMHPAAPRFASVTLGVTRDYTPRQMRVAVIDFDEWFEANLQLDPATRAWPGTLQNARFVIRFAAAPVFPLTVTSFADGVPRWRQQVRVPFWPSNLPGRGSSPGTAITLGHPDDGGTVAGPAELRSIAVDAKGRQVGQARFELPGTQPRSELASAMASIETGFRERRCSPPPPPID